MEEAGYLLAKGDRGYIIVDAAGDHSVLSRNLGMKKKEIEAFMTGVELDKLPTIKEAQTLQETRHQERKIVRLRSQYRSLPSQRPPRKRPNSCLPILRRSSKNRRPISLAPKTNPR